MDDLTDIRINSVYSSKSNDVIKLLAYSNNDNNTSTIRKRDNPMKLPHVACMNYGSSRTIHYMACKLNGQHIVHNEKEKRISTSKQEKR